MLRPLLLSALTTVTLVSAILPQQRQHHDQQSIIGNDIITTDTIYDKLLASEIIPQVLDDFQPSYQIDLLFSDPEHEPVSLGNTIPVDHASHRPVFTITKLATIASTNNADDKHDGNQVFTLVLTDPDAKSRKNPKWSEMCHWVVTNITAPVQMHDVKLLTKGDGLAELIEYLAPAPPKKTGPHRYVFVLLRGSNTDDLQPPSKRKHWGYGKRRHGVRDWAGENGLQVVGANYFYAQHKKQ